MMRVVWGVPAVVVFMFHHVGAVGLCAPCCSTQGLAAQLPYIIIISSGEPLFLFIPCCCV